MNVKKLLVCTGLAIGVLSVSACGSSQISSSLTENINYSITNTDEVEESSVVVEYSRGVLGPSVKITGDITYSTDYLSSVEDIYKGNIVDMAYITRDIGGIERGSVSVNGHIGSEVLESGLSIGKDTDKVKISKLLN